MVDINDIKVGDIVKMPSGAVYTINKMHDEWKYPALESTDGIFINLLDIEQRLNKYHIDDRVMNINDRPGKGTVIRVWYNYLTEHVVYSVKMDNTHIAYYMYEEDIIAMNEEKKVNFEVGDYVRIDHEKVNFDSTPAEYCGHLGIIVGQGYNDDYWRVYFFALKCTYTIEGKYMVKSKYEYEVKVKPKEEEYIKSDINATKQALNFIYGAANFESNSLPKIKKVIFNGPATIVMWGDGDKTVVHCIEGEVMDKEKGLAMAICKKALGRSKTHYDYYNVFKKWIKEK